MSLMFWKASKPQVVPQVINRRLVSEFGMEPELLDKLCVLEKNGKLSDRKVKMVRVFDPDLVSTGEGSNLKYDDLKGAGNEKALRFEGRFEKDGSLYLSDRRPKAGSPGTDSR